MRDDLILRTTSAQVATLTLNRPEKLNALTPRMLESLRRHLDAICDDRSVACVILTGAGRSFCAGHDLEALAGGVHDFEAEAETVDAVEELPQPVIAAVRGHCFTGGLELALACDLIVAADSAQFADTHAQWGLVPVWGMSVRLPERVGVATAKQLMYTARRVSGTDAVGLGLIDQVTSEEHLDSDVTALASAISENSNDALRIIKSLLADSRMKPRRAALDDERKLPYGMPNDSVERLTAREPRTDAPGPSHRG